MVKKELIQIDPKVDVILFGSRARGDFDMDSDWDFLILLDRELDSTLKALILENLYKLELQTNSVFSSLIHTKKDWDDRSITPLYAIIKKEGKRA